MRHVVIQRAFFVRKEQKGAALKPAEKPALRIRQREQSSGKGAALSNLLKAPP
jgi:hypothetical protein